MEIDCSYYFAEYVVVATLVNNHSIMTSVESSIGKLLAKRRLDGGEFCYVHLLTNKTGSGKKAALGLLQEDVESYKKFMDEFKHPGEAEESFNTRVIKMVQNISFEDVVSTKSSESEPQSHKTTQLSDLILRRRLEEGEFTYLYKSLEKPISGKKSVYQFLKSQTEDFNILKKSCKQLEETDEQFDERMLKELQTVPFEPKEQESEDLKIIEQPRKKVTYSNFVKSSSNEDSQVQTSQSEGFILPPKKSSPCSSPKKPVQAQIVRPPVELTPFEAEIEKFKSCHEPKHQWELKKKFMMAHKDSFHLTELVGLAQTFGNIEFLGCTYPQDTMRQARLWLSVSSWTILI